MFGKILPCYIVWISTHFILTSQKSIMNVIPKFPTYFIDGRLMWV